LTTNGIDYGYRIHGTPEWFSIGQNASSGCFRMINQDVMDLFERVQDGAKVVVLNSDGSYPTRLVVPPPQLPKAPEVAVTPVSATGDDAPLILNPALLNPPAQSGQPAAVCTVPLVNGLCPIAPPTTLPPTKLPPVSGSAAAP
jgi:hypothetical protein